MLSPTYTIFEHRTSFSEKNREFSQPSLNLSSLYYLCLLLLYDVLQLKSTGLSSVTALSVAVVCY